MKSMDISTAFFAGVVTFFTPCIFPIIPVFLAFVAGLTTSGARDQKPLYSILEILAFVLGISSIFVLLGYSAGSLGGLIIKHRHIIRYVGGALAIILGVQFIMDKYLLSLGFKGHPTIRKKNIPLIGSFMIGFSFGLGWSPCVGPMLATILVYAALTGSGLKGGILLLSYALGFGIPLFITGLTLKSAFSFFTRLTPYLGLIRILSGVAFLAIGIHMFIT